jgi:hypothetical protein
MSILLDNLKSVELTDNIESPVISPDETLTAVFEVKEPDYVPQKVRLRARVDSKMFTGSFTAADLKDIESDANIVSLELSRPLRLIE